MAAEFPVSTGALTADRKQHWDAAKQPTRYLGTAQGCDAVTVLRLPDLDQAKSAVLNRLSSADAQRGYRHAMDEFIEGYLAGRLCCAIAFTWNRASSPLAP